MKKIFTLTAAFLTASALLADDFYLYADGTDGEINHELVQVANLQKITFENGNVVLTKKDGSTSSREISSIKRLFFSTKEVVGVEETIADVSTSEGIYDLAGRKLNVDTSALSKGVYIINGEKVQVK